MAIIYSVVHMRRPSPAAEDEGPKRIVVLPFENLGPPEDAYFVDGITDEIVSRLGAVSGLQVISRTSAMHYKDRRVPVRQIGEELDVGYVLEGTIRWDRSGEGHGRVRITPQLIKVADDSHLWSERYARVLEDIFAVQSDIAGQVISQLQTTLLEPERHAIEVLPTNNMEAYQAYLLGMRYRWACDQEREARLAVEMTERAVELDPEFASAHALLSEVHSILYHFHYDFTDERLAKARVAAERSMELQPGLPEGHRALGWYYYRGYRDYDRAREQFALASKSLPNDADLLLGFFAVNKRQGRWDEALEALERWQRVDPQGYLAALNAEVLYRFLRRYGHAEEQARRAISIAPDHPNAYHVLARTYLAWDGATDRARRLLESAPSLESPWSAHLLVRLELYDRRPGSAMARLQEASIDSSSFQESYAQRELLECICLSEMGEKPAAEAACTSAVELLEREIATRPHDHHIYSAIGHAFALRGRKEEAVRAGERGAELMPILRDAEAGAAQARELAKIYTRVGETDKALDLIEELMSIPCDLSVGLLRLDPVWDPLRDHPRFQALLTE